MDHGRLRLIIVVVATLMLSTTFTFSSVHAAQPPIARIISVAYPRHVLPSRVFSVNVVAEYSDKVGVDLGIWDVQTGLVIQSVSIPLRQTGKTGFTFNLTAPTATMDWHLAAITRIWWQDAWYQDSLEGSEPFTIVVSNRATIALMSFGAPSTIAVDGAQYRVNDTIAVLVSMAPGVHQLEALRLIQNEGGERSFFVGWSDGVNSNPRQIVISSDVSIDALYRTEYYLSVKSARGQSSGSGWYQEGYRASFAVVPTSNAPSRLDLLRENYEFAGWAGDSNSSDTLASVTMSAPKNVEAKWVRSGMRVDFTFLSYAFLFGTLILFVRGALRYSRRGLPRRRVRMARRGVKLFALTTILIFVLIPLSSTYAQLPVQSGRVTVKIGDASWYYWNNTASDTCLLWLGGGVTQEQDIGYYSYRVNPFQYESFGTIRFMQELAQYYCVIALEEGSYASFSPNSNRTIYQEPYQMDSRIIGDVHSWIRKQGYAHTFLVGYSTGAQVAAMEVTLRAPEEWVSPDGVVLITPRLSNAVSQSAYRMRASLLVLYGGSIETPAYVSTGYEFYAKAPGDGLYDGHYLHKEFHVIENMGHEVWTIYATGAYDGQAVRVLVNFIDDVTSLQFTLHDVAMIAHAAENSSAAVGAGLVLTSVTAPAEVSAASIMKVEASFTYDLQRPTTATIVAFNPPRGKIQGVAEFVLDGSGSHVANLYIAVSSNSSDVSIEMVSLRKDGEVWQVTGKPVFTNTSVMRRISVTVASAVPNMPFMFDGAQFTTGENGARGFETQLGAHTVQVEPVTYLNTSTRAVFTGWDDGNAETTRQMTIDNDTSLFAVYRIQYYVNATSAYGDAQGSGWYDENSTIAVSVEPPIVKVSGVIFARWAGDASGTEIRSLLTVNSTKTVSAVWSPISNNDSIESFSLVCFLTSLVLFAVTLAWNIKPVTPTGHENDHG